MKRVKVDVRITDADTVSDALVRIYKETAAKDGAVAKDAALATIMGEVETLSAKITTAIKADKVSRSLEDADSKRDEAIRSLGTLLAGYGAIPIAAKKAAAEKLLATYDKYGKSIVSETYARESSLIESMLEDFTAESLADAIKSLDGVADLIASLRAAQDEFNAANDTATAALTEKGESAYAIKKPLLAAINEKLVPYLTAMAAVSAEYADFAAKADVEVSKANASVTKK
ncbi:MAG: hypothetical protein K2O09_10080 [Treponemataceae bacterium]|nr:hypothetical protein [Treponemataceae bacterium]